MSYTQIQIATKTNTPVSTEETSVDTNLRNRKRGQAGDGSPEFISSDRRNPIRRCRRHSFAFRCAETDIDESGDEGKHYESVLLVKVSRPVLILVYLRN
jgi:hypothetical protein